MIQIIIGSLVLSIIHAAIPNHWIPLVVIAKTENWTRREALWMTAITGSAHTASTILVGIVVGLVGYKLSSSYEFVTSVIAPSILVILGLTYIIIDLKSPHDHTPVETNSIHKRSKIAIIASLCVAMFFSPCIEIEAYFFTAGIFGWTGIVAVSIIYLILTIIGMVLLVDLGIRGVERIRWHYLEHHEKRVTGIVLIVLGLFVYFVKI